jgi:hypothetical protein
LWNRGDDSAKAADISIDGQVVRWISENDLDVLTIEQLRPQPLRLDGKQIEAMARGTPVQKLRQYLSSPRWIA